MSQFTHCYVIHIINDRQPRLDRRPGDLHQADPAQGVAGWVAAAAGAGRGGAGAGWVWRGVGLGLHGVDGPSLFGAFGGGCTCHPADQPPDRPPPYQTTNETPPTNSPTSHPTNQPTDPPTHQPTHQPTNRRQPTGEVLLLPRPPPRLVGLRPRPGAGGGHRHVPVQVGGLTGI
jgi:hypothetical protein